MGMPFAYRWTVIVTAAVAAVAMAFSIWFLTISFVDFRLQDFRMATLTSDFGNLGTCAGFITDDQLKAAGYNENVWGSLDCNDGNKKKFRKSLLVSVHGLYHMATRQNGKYLNSDLSEVIESVIPAVVGKETLIANDDGIQVMQLNKLLPSINTTVVYNVLSQVKWLPTDCGSIYSGAVKQDLYEQSLMKLKDTVFPINEEMPMSCGDETGSDDTADAIDDLYLWDKAWVKNRLYTHCLVQFRYASSGTENWGSGTFGIPMVGVEPGPMFAPFPDPAHYNDTHHDYYNVRTKMLLGQRFGWSMYAYVPMLLCSAFLMADAISLWLSESTAPAALADAALSGSASLVSDTVVMAATSKTVRARRLTLAFGFYLVGAILWGLYVVQAWGLNENKLARPICEPGDPDHEWNVLDSFKGTSGGWKADFDSNWLELLVIVAQGLVVLLVPLSALPIVRSINTCCFSKEQKEAADIREDAGKNESVYIKMDGRYKTFLVLFFPGIMAGTGLLIIGQVVVNTRLGWAWAEAVIGIEDPDRYNAVPLYEDVYKGLMSIFATVLASGFIVGTTSNRWLLNKRSKTNDLIILIWAIITFSAGTSLIVVSSLGSLFDEEESKGDCKKYFGEVKGTDPITGEADVVLQTKKDTEMTLCTLRFWFTLIGAGIVLAVLCIMLVIALLGYLGRLGQETDTTELNLSTETRTADVGGAGIEEAKEYSDEVAKRCGSQFSYGAHSNDFFAFKTGISVQGGSIASTPAGQTLLSKNRPANRAPMSNNVRFNLRSAVAQSPGRTRPYGNGGLP